MPKNALTTVGRKKEFTEVTVIIKDDARRTRLQSYIDEVIRSKQKILDENESIKALRDSAVEELNIEPKMFNNLVSLFFNNNFEQKKAELERLEAAINALMQTGGSDDE